MDFRLTNRDLNLCQTERPCCSYFSKLTLPPIQPQTLELFQLQPSQSWTCFFFCFFFTPPLSAQTAGVRPSSKWICLLKRLGIRRKKKLQFSFFSPPLLLFLLSRSLWRVNNIPPEANPLGTAPSFHGNWRNTSRQPEIESRRRMEERMAEYIWLLW